MNAQLREFQHNGQAEQLRQAKQRGKWTGNFTCPKCGVAVRQLEHLILAHCQDEILRAACACGFTAYFRCMDAT